MRTESLRLSTSIMVFGVSSNISLARIKPETYSSFTWPLRLYIKLLIPTRVLSSLRRRILEELVSRKRSWVHGRPLPSYHHSLLYSDSLMLCHQRSAIKTLLDSALLVSLSCCLWFQDLLISMTISVERREAPL